MLVGLSRTELSANIFLWTLGVFYSLYNFYKACKIFDYQDDIYNDFDPGWSFLKRRIDIADPEWQTILLYIKTTYLFLILHTAICEWIKCMKWGSNSGYNQIIHWFHFIYSLTYMIFCIHHKIILIVSLQPLIFLIFHWFKKKSAIWACGFLCLTFNTAYKYLSYDSLSGSTEMEYTLSILTIFWMNLRCLSYFLDKCEEPVHDTSSINYISYLGYCFYLPFLLCGPFVKFNNYLKAAEYNLETYRERIQKLLVSLGRIFFWLFFTQFILHFIYVNPMAYQIEHIKQFDSWTIYGYGYAMGQFFHLKYVVIYGFGSAFAEFDGIDVPKRPKCIGRIHLYSDMWKYFDEGFYKFTLSYIYIPFIGNHRSVQRQLFGTFISFAFVYIWHGVEANIFIWTVINFICVTIERLFNYFMQTPRGRTIQRHFSEAWKIRLHGIISSPLIAISAMSNSYFFGGKDVGDAFFHFFYNSDIYAKCTLFFLLYTCSQVSIEVKRREHCVYKKKKSI